MLEIIEPSLPIIDLTGPNGNVFYLLKQAKQWEELEMREKGVKHFRSVINEMMSGNYYHAVAIFEINFGSFCRLLMDDGLLKEVQEEIKRINSTFGQLKELGF